LEALEAALTRPTDALLPKKNKRRLIIDLASTDPAHGKKVLYGMVISARTASIPFLVFSVKGDCLRARLRPSNVHSANGALKFIKLLMVRYLAWFKLF
jgi:hypothetical protein